MDVINSNLSLRTKISWTHSSTYIQSKKYIDCVTKLLILPSFSSHLPYTPMATSRTNKNYRLVPNPISFHTSRISKELPQESIHLYSISSTKNEKRRTHSPYLLLNRSSAIITSERMVPEVKLHSTNWRSLLFVYVPTGFVPLYFFLLFLSEFRWL
ncbi:hypothetical protein CEXT_693811 [Caerostris extrusa]|uniref:Transmembrane protein n=1 Tax=Caerostris extrusa TaxID=172846 RepID=A0AAV4MFD3_CAEEX|nr:hypothetical protein CEXT_693811 [Caerostris extrusa]